MINDDPSRHPVEPLEAAPMAGQPSPDGLIFNDLRVLMAAPAEGHHQHPTGLQFPGVGIDPIRSSPEIDLNRVAGRKLQNHRSLRDGGLETL